MTEQKKLKRAVRARSKKTGESYTAARRQILLARETPEIKEEVGEAPAPPVVTQPSVPAAAKARGGVSEESVRKHTGHGLGHWFAVLDAFGAATLGHTAIAAHLHKDLGLPGWYAQGITVAYERARGLRQMNQSCTGKFQVSVSRTVPVSVAEVADALRSAARRAAWLEGADPGLVQALEAAFTGGTGGKPREVKTKGSGIGEAGETAWLRFPWAGATVEIRVLAKPKGGASVVASNEGLAGPELVEQRREQWRAALEGLKRHLGSQARSQPPRPDTLR